MALSLPKEAFVALAALGWADGRMTANEKTGLLRAAKECGVPPDDLAVVEAATKAQSSLSDFAPGELTEWQRVLVYALGCWCSRLDGVMSTEETASLAELAKRLNLAKPVCDRASAAAFDVSVLPEGGRPEKFDFEKLYLRLREKLPQLSPSA